MFLQWAAHLKTKFRKTSNGGNLTLRLLLIFGSLTLNITSRNIKWWLHCTYTACSGTGHREQCPTPAQPQCDCEEKCTTAN